jgi:predicted DNA-binding transcriptional regulator YafY
MAKNVENICNILKLLHAGRVLIPSDTALQEELGIEVKTLRRYLVDIESCFDGIICEKISRDGKKVDSYRVLNDRHALMDILRSFVGDTGDNFLSLMQLIYEKDPTVFEEYESQYKADISKRLAKEADMIKFYSNPLEDLQNFDSAIFKELKTSVKERFYKTITVEKGEREIYRDAKCLKLLFSKGNWYLAIETDTQELKLIRLSFITSLEHSSKAKFSYQKSVLDKYQNYFDTFQNPFSINTKKQAAILLAAPEIAMYFKSDMKPFFRSQRYIETLSDGSIKFEVSFTQFMEIKPFIKEWSPHISVIEPEELKQDIISDMQSFINKQS